MAYANEDYRNDPILLDAAVKMVERELAVLKESLPYLEKLYKHTSSLDAVKVWSLMDKTKWYIKFYTDVLKGEEQGTSAYAGNVAAFLSETEAEKIKAGGRLDKLSQVRSRPSY